MKAFISDNWVKSLFSHVSVLFCKEHVEAFKKPNELLKDTATVLLALHSYL